MPLLLGLLGAAPGAVGQSVTRLIIHNEVILRVPVQPRPLLREIEWVEHKGPKCIPANAIRWAASTEAATSGRRDRPRACSMIQESFIR